MRKANGFTIVEILIVVGIIGILTTIGFIGFSKFQSDARDSERESKATIISEALEKYFDENGEYPSCTDLTGDATTVSKTILEGIETQTLLAPQRASGETNSIKCDDLTELSNGDYFSYTGDTSEECTGVAGVACVLYVLKYKKENPAAGEDKIVAITSRRKTPITGSPTLTCNTPSFAQIGCSWSPISGSTSYDIERSTAADFTSNYATTSVTNPSATVTGLSYNTQYFLRVRANSAVGIGTWSDTIQASTLQLAAPTSLSITPTTSQLTLSWQSVTYASSYSVEYSANSSFSPVEGTASPTTASYTLTGLSVGTTKYFRVKAVNGAFSGNWSSTATGTTNVPVPTGLAATVNSTTQITASWSAVTSATSYDLDYSTSSTFSSFTTINTTSTSQAVSNLIPVTTYYFRVRANINAYTSAYSSSVNGTTQNPNPVLAGAATCAGTYSGRSAFQVRLTIQEVSYNITNNTSNINWTLYRYAASSGWASYDQTTTWGWSISIDGQGSSGSSNSGFWKNNASVAGETETISSGTKTITHNANGTKTISYSGSDGPGSSIFGSASCSGSGYVLSDLR